VGHYGVFNGSRFRAEIVPRISDFVLSNNTNSARMMRKPSTKTGAATESNGSAVAERSAPHGPELEAGAAAVSTCAPAEILRSKSQ
jgi:poly(3-hydroxybutyrate) depolymerase